MAAVGALTIHAWRGSVQGEVKETHVITRPGIDGTGLIVGEYQSRPFIVETDYYSTLVNVQAWRDLALTYPGTALTIIDGFGQTWTDTVVLDVSFTILAVSGLGASTHLITAQWQLMVDY